jgi:hypothetical protein
MPELPVKEIRLSELHLPEIKRDEIVRSLSEIRLPSLDLSSVERPKVELPDRIGRIDWRSIDVTSALAGAAASPGWAGRSCVARAGPSWPAS